MGVICTAQLFLRLPALELNQCKPTRTARGLPAATRHNQLTGHRKPMKHATRCLAYQKPFSTSHGGLYWFQVFSAACQASAHSQEGEIAPVSPVASLWLGVYPSPDRHPSAGLPVWPRWTCFVVETVSAVDADHGGSWPAEYTDLAWLRPRRWRRTGWCGWSRRRGRS